MEYEPSDRYKESRWKEEEAKRHKPEPSKQITHDLKSVNILIVDYDRDYRRTCKNILELQGFIVTEADDGIQGLQVLRQNNKTDIVLAALELPQMTALEFLKQAKVLSPQIAVIILATNPTIDTYIESERLGAYHYVSKSDTGPEHLVDIVKECAKSTSVKNTILKIGAETLDKSIGTNPTASRTFISYAWKDKSIAKKIMEDLSKNGIEVFIDFTEIVGGDSLLSKINDGLLWCNTLVLIWSEFAAKSYYVTAEWEAAFNLKRRIIPCILDNTPLPPLLKRVLHLGFASYEEGCNNLIQALKAKY